MRLLALCFIVVPLTEMMLLFAVSDRIGAWATLALVAATAIIGVQILRRQGLATLLRANQQLQTGALPAQEILEGMLLAAAGALLLTPGFITDTIGFLLLTGPIRRPLAGRLLRSGLVAAMGGRAAGSYRQHHSGAAAGSGTVVDAEYTQETVAEFSKDTVKDSNNRNNI